MPDEIKQETPAAPEVDANKELATLRERVKALSALENEHGSLKALVEQAKKDPDAALALAGLDFEELTRGVLENKIKLRSKVERAKVEEASELERLRSKVKEAETKEEKEKAQKAYADEIDYIKEQLPEELHPLLRLLGLEPAVRGKFYERREKDGKDPDLKEIAKELEGAVQGDIKKLFMHEKARAVIFADKELENVVMDHLNVSRKEAKGLMKALGQAAGPKDKAAAKTPAPKVDPKELSDEERMERAIAGLLSSKGRSDDD
jgi:hypothetical protein